MITIIGTAHVFNISEPVMFFVKHIWPDAVLVELDVTRYNAMVADNGDAEEKDGSEEPEKKDEGSWMFRNTAKYQQRLAKSNKSNVGNEMLTAVQMGRLVGAEIGFIDTNAQQTVDELWKEMSFGERMRYRLSAIKDRFGGRKEAQQTVENFSENEERMMADMRRKYPTLVRKLIDERNVYMADQIRDYASRFNNIVVMVGDAHVEGICTLLEGYEIRKIRMGDIINKEKLDKIRAELWNREREIDES